VPVTEAVVRRIDVSSFDDPRRACTITGPAGDMWLAHHGWTPGAVGYRAGGARSLRFATLQWDEGRVTMDGAASH
jgi:hypothetical protein